MSHTERASQRLDRKRTDLPIGHRRGYVDIEIRRAIHGFGILRSIHVGWRFPTGMHQVVNRGFRNSLPSRLVDICRCLDPQPERSLRGKLNEVVRVLPLDNKEFVLIQVTNGVGQGALKSYPRIGRGWLRNERAIYGCRCYRPSGASGNNCLLRR